MDPEERRRTLDRLAIVDGVLEALSSWSEVSALVQGAADRLDARRTLQDQLGFSELVANYVLDLPTSRTTIGARRHLQEEAKELRRLLDPKAE